MQQYSISTLYVTVNGSITHPACLQSFMSAKIGRCVSISTFGLCTKENSGLIIIYIYVAT